MSNLPVREALRPQKQAATVQLGKGLEDRKQTGISLLSRQLSLRRWGVIYQRFLAIYGFEGY